jgi:hypothetical protein
LPRYIFDRFCRNCNVLSQMHLELESHKLQHQELFLLLQSVQNERDVAVSASSSADATAAVASQLHRDESLLLQRQAQNSGM